MSVLGPAWRGHRSFEDWKAGHLAASAHPTPSVATFSWSVTACFMCFHGLIILHICVRYHLHCLVYPTPSHVSVPVSPAGCLTRSVESLPSRIFQCAEYGLGRQAYLISCTPYYSLAHRHRILYLAARSKEKTTRETLLFALPGVLPLPYKLTTWPQCSRFDHMYISDERGMPVLHWDSTGICLRSTGFPGGNEGYLD